jgi:5,10-methylenetetrahydrofolate reductase
VFDLDSVQLLEAVSALNAGHDLAGGELDGRPALFAGAVVNSTAELPELQVLKLRKKVAAGARFFQTQAVFAPERFHSFLERVKDLGVPVIAGLVLLKSPATVRFLTDKVPGVDIPAALIEEVSQTPKEERRQKALEIAVTLVRRLKPLCQGVHLMTLGWEDLIPEILTQAEVRDRPWTDPENPHIPE